MQSQAKVCERSRCAVGKGQMRSRACRGSRARRGEVVVTRALNIAGVDIPVPDAIPDTIEALKSVDVNAIADQAKDLIPPEVTDYVNSIDQEYIKAEVADGLTQVKGALGDGLNQVNTSVVQPYWKEQAPVLEAYFRNAWGDYYYDYFIDEWNSGVNDLNRLYNFLDNTVVAGDWKRFLALAGATWYSPGFLSFVLSLNKGYKGNLNALDALQMIEKTGGKASLVDVRMDNEKFGGSPDLPRRLSRSYLDVGYARDWLTPDVMKLSKDKDLMMSKATSTVIADLKRINGNKKQPVIVIDSSDDGRAKSIAKMLTQEHKLTCYVVRGGFDAWKRNKLPVFS
ncbi:hypothetical protein HOP50_17g80790 [Chloropicon primus]|uniref:Rhodanese domain-containing protein n=1 Tax=Chloropicon primus TaxID=1764295 RepID=A0A5B8MYB6_9CHLO|nr:hypothetical protein A3770_17p80550 [Chloropicon primus]UPR04734.1 hypothetical protein HOP50_17g80790 [Chloropicon primus]|mmetsp:Transcript_5557/g.16870  ORF Transcript_5557/g.16870 Transcript_5557/m.16870 type:complete len:340 (-) Transcript_5557:78-1097(-)|eukprot:QDZ25537.1 hypothetical protein A3770_17p80550 [Chloropicon primus]